MIVEKIIRGHLCVSALAAGIRVEGKATKKIAADLQMHYLDTMTKDVLVRCRECQMMSHKDDPVCPYCNDGAEDKSEEGGISVLPKTQPEEHAAGQTQPVNGAQVPEKEPPMSKETTHVNGNKQEPARGLMMAGWTPPPLAKTEADLNKAVHLVGELKSEGAAAMWRLGKAVYQLHETQIWKLRTHGDGLVKYRSFGAFCFHELGMSEANAYKIMDVARNFTEGDVRKVGTHKLALVLWAPPEDQAKLLEKVKNEKITKHQLQKEITEIRSEKGFAKSKQGNPAKKHATAIEKEKVEKEKVAAKATAILVEGKKSVTAYCKPARKTKDPAQLKEMRRLADVPWTFLELENEMTIYVSLIEGGGGKYKFNFEFVRTET